MQLDIDIEGWPKGDWEALVVQAADAAGQFAPELTNPRLQTSVLFTSDEEIHALNQQWRGRDKPTNVLSFPMLTQEQLPGLGPDGPPVMLGDLALAYETCAREADEKNSRIEDHAAHLIVHGLLHLAGHDHEISDSDAEKMEELEVQILAKMGVADPYSED